MKNVSKALSLLLLFGAFLLVGCDGKGDSKSEEEVQLEKLKATWTISSVKNDGQDRTGEYPGMTVTITGTYSDKGTYNYVSAATDWPSVSPWKGVDTWKFSPDAISSHIIRQSDLIDMAYELSNGDKTLKLTFDYSGPGFNNGRTASVSGGWEFTFTRP